MLRTAAIALSLVLAGAAGQAQEVTLDIKGDNVSVAVDITVVAPPLGKACVGPMIIGWADPPAPVGSPCRMVFEGGAVIEGTVF